MELAWIKWLQQQISTSSRVMIPIGDDAAWLDWSAEGGCVTATDLLADGVHFHLEAVDPEAIGYKSLAVNLSDMAAMAAVPRAATISLLLPDENSAPLAEGILNGVIALAKRFDVEIVGGDTNVWAGNLVTSVNVLGESTPRGLWRRDRAEPGDRLLVTGDLGGSLFGKHLHFVPRVAEALLLNQKYTIHAAMDISDGLGLDLRRLGTASGLGGTLDADSLPISHAAINAFEAGSDRTALEHALFDGEDFELLLAVPEKEAKRLLADQPLDSTMLTEIGTLHEDPSFYLIDQGGKKVDLPIGGFEHGNRK
ncbi:Thiamine-monophosphate kinase [Planctomycetales bacterium 10988]|nr:Thiamine-monophosphate kinase [Planctomycetales bacterium 10988]